MKPLLSKTQVRGLILDSGFASVRHYVDEQLDRFYESYLFLAHHYPEMTRPVILDIGSFNGIFLPVVDSLIRQASFHTLDCDIPPHGQTVIKSPNGPITVFTHGGNIETQRLPIDEGTMDLVILAEVIEHLPDDPMAALLEINRVLKTGAHLFISTPNAVSSQALSRLVKGTNPEQSPALWPKHLSFKSHRREYTPEEIKTLLTCSGYEVAAFNTSPLPSIRLRIVMQSLRILSRIPLHRNNLGETSFFLAKKQRSVTVAGLKPEFRYPEPIYATERFQCKDEVR